MNREEAKTILLLYRTPADAADPQVAAALALAEQDPELARWFEEYRVVQDTLRERFRQLPAAAGLKEQILSEQAAKRPARERFMMAGAIAAIVIALVTLGVFYLPHGEKSQPQDLSLASYQKKMTYLAARGYAMYLVTNDLKQIQGYLAQNQAPADYVLHKPLETTTATGCAIQFWNGSRVAMICFSTGKPLAPGRPGDLWLFIVNQNGIKDAPTSASPQLATVNGIITATWSEGGKLYVLGTLGDEQAIRKYL